MRALGSGRRPKPLSVRAAEGDLRKIGKRKLAERIKSEPVPESGYGAPPPSLSGEARTLWDLLAAQLEIMGLQKRPDCAALHGACRAYGEAIKADADVDQRGQLIDKRVWDRDAEAFIVADRKANPSVGISVKYWTIYVRFCSEFGLTPVSRTRLANVGKDGDKGSAAKELAEILSRPRMPRPTKPFVVPPEPESSEPVPGPEPLLETEMEIGTVLAEDSGDD
jgi:P27 family predicted phage terminase small subunit